MADDKQKFRVTYTGGCHPEGITKEQIPEGFGGCDCLLIASILGQPGGPGPLSVQFASLNGFKGDGVSLTPMQEFAIFPLLANYLAESLPDGAEKQICQEAFEKVTELVLKKKVVALATKILKDSDDAPPS